MPNYDIVSTPYTLTTAPDSGNCNSGEACASGKSDKNYFATYIDGPRILICICNGSMMNITGMAFRQGQVPLPLRSSVATIVAGTSDDSGGGAYTYFNDVSYFGNSVPNVFIHESAHALDFAQGDMYGSFGLSGVDAWYDAINEDSCVPDPYATSDETEDFAQVTVARYGALSTNVEYNPKNTTCMIKQRQYAAAALPKQHAFDSKDKFYIYNANNQYLTTTAIPDNSPLSLSPKTGNASQIWKIMPTAYDWLIACDTFSYKCVDNERDDSVGKNAITTYRTAFISMQHKFVPQGDNTYKIVNRISGLVLSSGCRGQVPNDVVYTSDIKNKCTTWNIKSAAVPASTTSSTTTTRGATTTTSRGPTTTTRRSTTTTSRGPTTTSSRG